MDGPGWPCGVVQHLTWAQNPFGVPVAELLRIRAGSQALPGLAAAALGASKVVVSDSGRDIIRLLEKNVEVRVYVLVATGVCHDVFACSCAPLRVIDSKQTSKPTRNQPSNYQIVQLNQGAWKGREVVAKDHYWGEETKVKTIPCTTQGMNDVAIAAKGDFSPHKIYLSEQELGGPFDYVLVAEFAYIDEAMKPLVDSIRKVSHAGTTVVCSYGRNRRSEQLFRSYASGFFDVREVSLHRYPPLVLLLSPS